MNLPVSNFLAWYFQIGLAVIAGALLPLAFRLRAPKPQLIFWHMLLIVCVALPMVQPWRPQPIDMSSNISISTGPLEVKPVDPNAPHQWTPIEIALAVLICGAFLRLLWLSVGLFRLRRYRRAAEPLLPLPDEARRMIGRLGVHADFYLSEDVHSPVTFGARTPVVLLPAGFLELSPEAREPVICHELLHIQRNDWLFAIAEEVVRCALWFHPAVWWLLGRIQLTREQVVDQAVIEYTQAADAYVDALLAIAYTHFEADLAPAPLFLKKHHLRQRVASIVKGVSMSKRSLLLSSVAVFSALPLVVGFAAWQFPLNAAPQEVRDSPGVEVKAGAFKLLHRTPVAYPLDAREKGISGMVMVAVTLSSSGEVADAKVTSGPEELRKAALSSVLYWHFATDGGASTFEVPIVFTAGQGVPASRTQIAPNSAATRIGGTLAGLDLSRVPSGLRDRVSRVNLPHEGDVVTVEGLQGVETELKKIDHHFVLTGQANKDGKLVVHIFLSDVTPVATTYQAAGPGQLRVGGNMQATKLITKVTPAYPPLAKQSRIQGVVRMTATIDKEGHVANLDLITGHPLLAAAAMDAVRQWIYSTTLLNGNPVEVITQIDVNFTLLDDAPPPAAAPPQ